ncbi:hypothetical protein Dda_2678 [Drechslerella dactyloides]|uniref:Translation initiation factor 3 N-terminal domain-containing protein n=1 Tax=Drechslerella dactyloides TaxID=74499 RepID=A0AAD6NKI4_DREDA|nr:hypothetical protein Dda_2678 [Drechslerella dactyloides]
MALRQITRATCRNLHRPSLSLLSIYAASSSSSALPPSFLLPSGNHDRLGAPHPTRPAQQHRHASTSIRFPASPNLGPQFINDERVRFPYDEEITAHTASYVDETGKLVGKFPVSQILRSYDHNKYHLIQLANADTLPDTAEGHVVRLFPKEALLARIAEERETAVRRKKKSPRDIVKEVQIAWGIDLHDLRHRLGKTAQLLEKGNRVEIMIAKKKGQQPVPPERLAEVMAVVEDFLYYNGGDAVRKRDGEVGGQLRMFVQRPENWVPPPPKPEPEPEPEPVEGEGEGEEGGDAEGQMEGQAAEEATPAAGEGTAQSTQDRYVPPWSASREQQF